MASKLIKEEGVGSLYKGLSAGLLRQATYTTARLGIYQYISDALTERHQGKVWSFKIAGYPRVDASILPRRLLPPRRCVLNPLIT